MNAGYTVDPGRVVHETLEGEVILIHLQSGNYYSLRGLGADIWSWLQAGVTEADIVGALQARYGQDEAIAVGVSALLDDLMAEGLVERTDAPETAPPAAVFGGAPAAPADFEAPVLEKYTDMRDYLLVDPLHDVDARGWPELKPD